MKKSDLEYIEFRNKYKKKLANALGDKVNERKEVTTNDYETFKKTFLPKNLSLYEKMCNFSEKLMPISPDKKKIPKIEESIRISHLDVSPTGTSSFALMIAILCVFAFLLLGIFISVIDTTGEVDLIFFVFAGLMMGLILFVPLTKLPEIIGNSWRMKASNQMVLSVFYVVTYMRHTPNLELAIDFAAEHLSPPLSLDFKKVIWDIETGKFDSVNESLDHYLEGWRKYNQEFIESMNLIQGSLYESTESRRQDALEKSLQVILDETYEKMLHFTHDLKSPMTTLHMLGIVLPILGLVILPLMTAFIPETKWYHLFLVYNVVLPILVYYLGMEILSNRPTGYGGLNIAEQGNQRKEGLLLKGNKDGSGVLLSPKLILTFLLVVFLFIGFFPLLIHSLAPDWDLVYSDEQGITTLLNIDDQSSIVVQFLDYRPEDPATGTGPLIGPYGLGASILSLFIPLAFGIGFGIYYKLRSSNIAKIKERAKKLEMEFASALFQLGNRLADGIPAEIAFGNIAKVMRGTYSGKFFEHVSINIVKLGMGVEEAIFDEKVGAINKFPSNIVESSMKVFIESSKKGPLIASQALMTVGEYIKSMHRVDERLKDLMADIVSSMKSQVAFLTPAISGIVVGITSMITQIIGTLVQKISSFNAGTQGGLTDSYAAFSMLQGGGVPTFYFQAIVGLYVVQITYILTVLVSGIENGPDKLSRREMLAKNLVKSTLLYIVVAGVFTLMFSIIASTLIRGIA